MYVRWYDGSMNGDLSRAKAQCMDVNARNYRWSGQSRSKVCQMCDMGEDETVEHVVLECEMYDRDRMEMMHVILTEMGCEMIERTGRQWMVMLLGLWWDEWTDDWRGERVSGENVCVIEKLGRVIRVCIFFLFLCAFHFFSFLPQELSIQRSDLRETSMILILMSQEVWVAPNQPLNRQHLWEKKKKNPSRITSKI